MCSCDNISGLKRMRRKIQNTSFFSSITKYVPALHSRSHHTLVHANSPLNWQFKWVTKTEYDIQNYIRIHWISYSLLHSYPEIGIESAGVTGMELCIFMPCPRGFSLWFCCKSNFSFVVFQTCFLLLFFRLSRQCNQHCPVANAQRRAQGSTWEGRSAAGSSEMHTAD